MATWEAQELATDPPGFPGALVAGAVVNLRLFIRGEPVPTARPRARVVNPGNGRAPFVQFYPDKKSAQYEDYVAGESMRIVRSIPLDQRGGELHLPLRECRLLVHLRFNMPKPKSYPARVVDHTRKPDVDNLSKGVLDGLVKGSIITDDNAVTDLSIQKRYADFIHQIGVEVDLTAIPTET